VGDDHGGRAELPVYLRDGAEHQPSGLDVEGSGRLIAQQALRALGDGPCDRDALLLAPGQLRGKVVAPIAQANQRERSIRVHRAGHDVGHQLHVLDIRL
jgi:hypothetical protein